MIALRLNPALVALLLLAYREDTEGAWVQFKKEPILTLGNITLRITINHNLKSDTIIWGRSGLQNIFRLKEE